VSVLPKGPPLPTGFLGCLRGGVHGGLRPDRYFLNTPLAGLLTASGLAFGGSVTEELERPSTFLPVVSPPKGGGRVFFVPLLGDQAPVFRRIVCFFLRPERVVLDFLWPPHDKGRATILLYLVLTPFLLPLAFLTVAPLPTPKPSLLMAPPGLFFGGS